MKTRKSKRTIYEQVQDNHAMVQRVEEGLPVMEVVKFGKPEPFSFDPRPAPPAPRR